MFKIFTILLFLTATSFAGNGWVALFNGKDFTNFGGTGKTEHIGYVAKDGIIESTKKCGYLFTEQSFTNYVLDFEFQLTSGANNGLGIHYPGKGNPSWDGMELQILDDTAEKYKDLKDYQFHGSLYSMAAAKKGHLKPIGEWNHQRVIISGDLLSVILNGHLILSVSLSEMEKMHPDHKGAKRRDGRIAFCGHGDIIRLKNLKLLEIK